MFPLTPDQHHWLEVATEDEGYIIGHFGDDFTGHMKDWPNQQCHSIEG